MKGHILLTGATGFLGSHLLEALLKNGYKVTILKRSTSDIWRIAHLLEQVTAFDVDLVPLKSIFFNRQIDSVFHLATFYRKLSGSEEVVEMVKSNIEFPLALLEEATNHNVSSFINTGTFFECDCSNLPVNEDAELKPFNFYAKTKIGFESILKTYKGRMRTATLRMFSPYGERDNEKLIPAIIKKALVSETIQLSDGMQKLDFVYVDDIISAYIKTLKFLRENDKAAHQVFNIGSGIGISVREVISVLEQYLGQSIKKTWGEPSQIDIPAVFADITKAREVLSWTPTYNIHQGLKKTFEYYKGVNHENK